MVSVLVGFSPAASAAARLAEPPMTSGVKLVAPITLSSVRRSIFVIALLLILEWFSPLRRCRNPSGPRHSVAHSRTRCSVRLWNSLSHVDPARHVDPLAGHEARGVGSQKHHDVSDVVGLLEPPKRRLR